MTPDGVDELLALSERDLLIRLGEQLAPPGPGIGPEDEDRAESAARAWLRAHWQELRNRICGADEGRTAAGRATDASAVVDAISGYLDGPVVFTVAAIMLKVGLERICAGDVEP